MRLQLFLLFFLSLWSGCTTDSNRIPVAPDYANPVYWYQLPATPAKEVDLFYVYPTLGTTPTDADRNPLPYTNVDKKEEREAAAGNQRYNKEVYADTQFNFYAPFYRQMIFDIYARGRDYARQMQYIPVTDIRTAFAYYMAHFNQGRPFILIGHSQGSNILIELLKEGMTDEQYSRMVAAYLIGFEITAEELAAHPKRLRPAKGAHDTGVVISYNSVTNPAAHSPLLKHTAVCINPINWTTDGTPAPREAHKGIIKFDKQQGKYVTTPHYTAVRQEGYGLVCPDVPADPYYNEKMRDLFPYGNLHMADSWLYSVNLKENMAERAAAFQRLNQ